MSNNLNKNKNINESKKVEFKNYRIQGVLLDNSKSIYYALQGVYGIGKTRAKIILHDAQIVPETKTHLITEEQFSKIQEIIEKMSIKLEGDLRQEVYSNINTLKTIRSYRGIRHKAGLPVRGQNTRKNARTRKGKVKIAVGGLNKPIAKK